MLESGESVGRYIIESALGSGAMGTVYRARDTVLRRDVALKILEAKDHQGTGVPTLDDESRARFVREARAAASIQHTNIVAVYDVGEHAGIPYLAMELVIGKTLRAMIGDAEISIPMRVRWLVEIARALYEAHQHRLVHRDVKPENVLVSVEGIAKLADFGIVKQWQRESQPAPMSFRTKTGQLVGTPDYMAPEQWASSDVDGRADQYAWGLVAHELLTGRPLPLGRPQPIQTIAPSLPDVVALCVTRAIEHLRDDRFASMKEIIDTLEPFASEMVTDAARTRSLPPKANANANANAVAIGIAPTLRDVPQATATATATATVTATSTVVEPDPKRAAETDRRGQQRLRDEALATSARASATRTFVLAVAITLAIALVIVAILAVVLR